MTDKQFLAQFYKDIECNIVFSRRILKKIKKYCTYGYVVIYNDKECKFKNDMVVFNKLGIVFITIFSVKYNKEIYIRTTYNKYEEEVLRKIYRVE